MEVKLGTHVYLSVSMTTIDKKIASGTFPITTFSLHFSNLHTIQCMEVKLGTVMELPPNVMECGGGCCAGSVLLLKYYLLLHESRMMSE